MTNKSEIKAAAFDTMAKALDYESYTDRDPMILCTAVWEVWRLRNDMAKTLGLPETTDTSEIMRIVCLAFYGNPAEIAPAAATVFAATSVSNVKAKAHVYDEIVKHLELDGLEPQAVAREVINLSALKREASAALGRKSADCASIAFALRDAFSGEVKAKVAMELACQTNKPAPIMQELWNSERFEGREW